MNAYKRIETKNIIYMKPNCFGVFWMRLAEFMAEMRIWLSSPRKYREARDYEFANEVAERCIRILDAREAGERKKVPDKKWL